MIANGGRGSPPTNSESSKGMFVTVRKKFKISVRFMVNENALQVEYLNLPQAHLVASLLFIGVVGRMKVYSFIYIPILPGQS